MRSIPSKLISWGHDMGKGRLLLWGALSALVVLLLGVLAFLARSYEDSEDQLKLEQAASSISADILSGLHHSVQDLQTISVLHASGKAYEWIDEFSARHREVAYAEVRDLSLRPLKSARSPYLTQGVEVLARSEVLESVRQACDTAARLGEAGYAPSYFWPFAQGKGEEVMEMCFPARIVGGNKGYLVVTYRLQGMLSELVRPELQRNRVISLTDLEGARLSTMGLNQGPFKSLRTAQTLELPGVSFSLQVDQPRRVRDLFPNVLSATVALLSLALLTVLMLLARDVRKRQQAESDLAASLAFRQAMENSLVTALRASDMAGRITYVNPAFCNLVGLPADGLIGSGLPAAYWPPELAPEYAYRRALRTADPVHLSSGFETEYMRADGIRVPVRIFEAPLLDPDGKQSGWMSSILDVSEQRRMEELTRTSQERLQATARLAMAGEMASLISHELNQPLAAISSYANGSINLLETATEVNAQTLEEVQTAMHRMAAEAARAGKVIQSVGDLVRRRERARESVEVQALFDAIAPLLRLRAGKEGVALRWDLEDACPPVWCDRTMVEQVLLNLTRNGIQAMPLGVPPTSSGLRVLTLSAQLLPQEATGARAWVKLCVLDHGHGLSDEVQQQLFTPFFTTKTEGMGLGLSLCRTVVEQHGGRMKFDAVEPTGTAFSFTLPAAT